MENPSRAAGYILSLLAVLGLMAVVAFLEDGSLFRRALIKVSFPDAGTLMEDDPVKMRGVEVGRVDRIEPGPGGPLVTLELYKKSALPRDTRFVNFNYSLFGARMIVLVPGRSAEPLDPDVVQAGHFSSGVTESIHKVDQLLRTVVEYQGLASRLEKGGDSALSLQQTLNTKVYPALEEFGAFAEKLDRLQDRATGDLETLARASGQVQRYSRVMAVGTDTLVVQANRTMERLALLTTRSMATLAALERMMLVAQDTSGLAGRVLMNRELYERSLVVAHALTDLLRKVEKEGLKDVIGFWRNVHFRRRD